MAITNEQLAQTAVTVLEVLGDLGLPGSGVARIAIKGVESVRASKEAQKKLTERLEKAEEDFLQEARKQGMDAAHQWVASMRQQNRPVILDGLKRLLETGDERELEDVLALEFAREPQAKEAARLYLMCVYRALLGMEDFCAILTAIHALRARENTGRLLAENQELKQQLEALNRAVNRWVGLPENLLIAPERPLPAQIPPHLTAFLLDARYRLIEYQGTAFERTLKELCDWAESLEGQPLPVGLRIYTAAGGSGKTRLLLEATLRLREAGWWTGFIGVNDLTPAQAEILAQDARPTFIVVDYLDLRPQTVLNLLKAMAQALSSDSPRQAPLALVLAERHFPDWLKREAGRGSDPSYSGLLELYAQLDFSEHPLPAFETPEERAVIFRHARDALRQRLGKNDTGVDYPPEDLPGRPLYLLLLALHAAEGLRVEQPQDEQQILEHTWKREREAYARLLRPQLEAEGAGWAVEACVARVERLRALAALGRRFECPEAVATFLRDRFQPLRSAMGISLDVDWLAQQMTALFAGEGGESIPPIRPDPLADYVLANLLKAESDPLLREASLLESAFPHPAELSAGPEAGIEHLRRLLEVLGRLWNHPEFPRWRENLCRYLEDLPVEVVSGTEEASRFWQGMSFISEAALWAEVRLIALQKGRTTISPEDVPDLAMSLNNLANRYSELNRREEALRAAEEAVRLLIPFFVQIPEGFFPWMRTMVSTYTALAPDSPLTIPARTGLALKDLSHHPRPEVADTARRLLEMVRFD